MLSLRQDLGFSLLDRTEEDLPLPMGQLRPSDGCVLSFSFVAEAQVGRVPVCFPPSSGFSCGCHQP